MRNNSTDTDSAFPGSVLFNEILSACETEYAEKGVYFLEEDYIRKIDGDYSLFPAILDDVIEGAAEIRNDSRASLYVLYLSRAMAERESFLSCIDEFTFDPDYPMLPLLSFLPFIPDIYSRLSKKGVPEDIILRTLSQFEDCAIIYSKRYDRTGLNERYFAFLQKYVDCRILNIGRLRFEIMNLEDPVYAVRSRKSGEVRLLMGDAQFNSKGLYPDTPPAEGTSYVSRFIESGTEVTASPVSSAGRCENREESFSLGIWDIVLRPGDCCLSVHIPDKGDFSADECEKSYSRALEVFGKCFPEYTIKAFHCESWMMAPELSEHLKPGSRILSFASPYLRYPVHSRGEDVLNFVFNLKFKDYEDLSEDTSLQRSLKKLYLSGGRIFEYGGIIVL